MRLHQVTRWGKSIDIFLPGDNNTMLITERITPLGDIVIRQVQAEEIAMEHFGGCEDMLRYLPDQEWKGLYYP
jgi:hypothetical protein